MPDDFLDSLAPAKRAGMWERLLADGSNPRPFVALHDNEVVGFCHASKSRDDDATPDVGEVTAIYLLPEYVGKGLGHQLWTSALDYLREQSCSSVTVWVLDTNERGRAFYQRLGMKADGATKSDDRRGFPIMELRYRGAILPE